MSCISFLVRINYKDTAYCKLDNLKFVFRKRNEMKKILAVAVCLSLIIGMVPFVAFAKDSNALTSIKINEELDALLMGLEDDDVKLQLYDYFYLPAYSKLSLCDEKAASEKINNMKSNSEKQYALAKRLVALDEKSFNEELSKLIEEGASVIAGMPDIVVEPSYINYVKPYVEESVIKALEEKTEGIEINDLMTASTQATSKSKTFMKEYGSATTVAYCMFKIKASWTSNGTSITALSTSNQEIVTPGHIQTFVAKKNTSRNGAYGYVQRGWGYTNALYGTGQVVGYYIIDVKLHLASVSKENLTTIQAGLWNTYSWG